MDTRKMMRHVGVCGGLLLVLLLMHAAGAGQARLSAQEPIVAPTGHVPTAITEDAALSPSCVDRDENGVGSGGRQFQEDPGSYGPGPSAAGNESFLPHAEGSLQHASRDQVTAVCPIDSDFNGTANGWVSHSGEWYYNSEYLYTSGIEGKWASASYVADFADFDYEVRMWRSGSENNANFIVFRGTPDPLTPAYNWYHEYKLQYSRAGDFSVWVRVAGGSPVAIVPWTFSPAINQGDAWNTLRVVADGTSLTFYINDTLVWSGTDSSLSSGRAGVGMYTDSTDDELRVDWARLCLVRFATYLPLVTRQ